MVVRKMIIFYSEFDREAYVQLMQENCKRSNVHEATTYNKHCTLKASYLHRGAPNLVGK
jgi:hypothetical protein